jgi:hypothetical protein
VNRLSGPANDGRAFGSATIAKRDLCRLVGPSATTSTPSRWDQTGRCFRGTLAILLRLDLLLLDRHSPRAADERGVELVGVARVRQRPGKVGPNRPVLGWGGRALA